MFSGLAAMAFSRLARKIIFLLFRSPHGTGGTGNNAKLLLNPLTNSSANAAMPASFLGNLGILFKVRTHSVPVGCAVALSQILSNSKY